MKNLSINLFCHNEGNMISSSWNSIVSNLNIIKGIDRNFEAEINIIVDSGNYETYRVIENLKFYDFNLIQVTNKDLGLNRNFAVEKSRFEWVSFIDADDVWGKQWLLKSLNDDLHYKNIYHPEFIVYFGINPEIMIQESSSSWRFAKDLANQNCWTSSILCHKETIFQIPFLEKSEIQPFDFEDWNWNRRTLTAKYIHRIIPKTYHFIRQRNDSLSAKQIFGWSQKNG